MSPSSQCRRLLANCRARRHTPAPVPSIFYEFFQGFVMVLSSRHWLHWEGSATFTPARICANLPSAGWLKMDARRSCTSGTWRAVQCLLQRGGCLYRDYREELAVQPPSGLLLPVRLRSAPLTWGGVHWRRSPGPHALPCSYVSRRPVPLQADSPGVPARESGIWTDHPFAARPLQAVHRPDVTMGRHDMAVARQRPESFSRTVFRVADAQIATAFHRPVAAHHCRRGGGPTHACSAVPGRHATGSLTNPELTASPEPGFPQLLVLRVLRGGFTSPPDFPRATRPILEPVRGLCWGTALTG